LLPVAFRVQRLLPQKLIALTSKSIIAALARLIDAPEKIADVLKSSSRKSKTDAPHGAT